MVIIVIIMNIVLDKRENHTSVHLQQVIFLYLFSLGFILASFRQGGLIAPSPTETDKHILPACLPACACLPAASPQPPHPSQLPCRKACAPACYKWPPSTCTPSRWTSGWPAARRLPSAWPSPLRSRPPPMHLSWLRIPTGHQTRAYTAAAQSR